MNPASPRPKWKKGHKIAMAIIGGLFALVLLVVVIAAIAGSGDTEPETQDTGIPTGFDDYLADLAAIDPGITEGRPEQSVYGDANNTCFDIEQGTDEETLLNRVMERYGVNEAESLVTEDVAQQILDVTREHCGTIRPE